ncbi:MAG: DUF6069 family protein [Streptosporangiaceae bacterium]|jgi:uncharacterized protein DUF6069
MTEPLPPAGRQYRSARPRVDAGKLWSGGLATAVVAALIALVGVLVCRWLFKIPVLAPQRDGTYGDAHTTAVVLLAAAAALVATGVAHLLLLSVPRPMTFFSWIIGLATVLVVIFPFSTTAPLSAKAATAIVSLIVGIAIGSLLNGVAARAMRPPAAPAGYQQNPRYDQPPVDPRYADPRYQAQRDPGYQAPGDPRY